MSALILAFVVGVLVGVGGLWIFAVYIDRAKPAKPKCIAIDAGSPHGVAAARSSVSPLASRTVAFSVGGYTPAGRPGVD